MKKFNIKRHEKEIKEKIMSHTIALFSEVIVLVFNILIFMKLMVPKKESPIYYTLMYVGSAIILITFFACTYFGILPEALGSFICVTIPTFILYFALSKYKDFRFFVTFCFLDTITLAIVAISRCIGIIGGEITETISSVLVCTIMFFVYFTTLLIVLSPLGLFSAPGLWSGAGYLSY